jgi:hypothetical protein
LRPLLRCRRPAFSLPQPPHSAERTVRFPRRPSRFVCNRERQCADDFFTARRGRKIDRLIPIIRRRVVPIYAPIPEDFPFARIAGTDVNHHRGDAVTDEIVLIAVDKNIVQRRRVACRASVSRWRTSAASDTGAPHASHPAPPSGRPDQVSKKVRIRYHKSRAPALVRATPTVSP